MKKNGMTLPEIMITMVIIGIISALIIPMANYSKPNETKINFLKNYDELTNAINELANNSKIFPVCQLINGNTYCFENFPFLNDEEINDENGNTLFNNGVVKLCETLAFQYDVDANDVNCSDSALPANFRKARDNNFSFTTKTGQSYRVLTDRVFTDENNAKFISEILIDVNGNGNGNDCEYAAACQDPDTFRIWVTGDGGTYIGDRAGEYYLRTRQNVKSKYLDIRDTSNITAPSNDIANTNIRKS